ncbi:PH domain-containing protein [Marivirga tractuosa]|uniref:PH domain-containing protein n=1 Tax=Marivirga tractuosa TaxID=1006 RepID=UPI0035CF4986
MGLFSAFTSNSGVIESVKLAEDYNRILLNSEEIEVGFKIKEDTFIFTNKRLIYIEVRKGEDSGIEYTSLPYSQIASFGVDSKKSFDSKATLKVWINGQQYPIVETEFNKSVDVYEVQKILAGHVLK